jgi:hypothetical protein
MGTIEHVDCDKFLRHDRHGAYGGMFKEINKASKEKALASSRTLGAD